MNRGVTAVLKAGPVNGTKLRTANELLFRLVSLTAALATPLTRTVPPAIAVAVMFSVAEPPPVASGGSVQVTVLPETTAPGAAIVPRLPESVKVTVEPVATSVPLFVAAATNVRDEPTVAEPQAAPPMFNAMSGTNAPQTWIPDCVVRGTAELTAKTVQSALFTPASSHPEPLRKRADALVVAAAGEPPLELLAVPQPSQSTTVPATGVGAVLTTMFVAGVVVPEKSKSEMSAILAPDWLIKTVPEAAVATKSGTKGLLPISKVVMLGLVLLAPGSVTTRYDWPA